MFLAGKKIIQEISSYSKLDKREINVFCHSSCSVGICNENKSSYYKNVFWLENCIGY